MRKTFPLQVWQTAGLILDTPLSHAASNLHSDNFTASRGIISADEVLSIRHRRQGPGQPSPTASPTPSFCAIRSSGCVEDLRLPEKTWRLKRMPVGARSIDAPTEGANGPVCPIEKQRMHPKKPAQTVKCVNIYTNASFVYVRSTL
ncbi:hypothetical protein RZO07_04450 [Pseudomonas protegens]|uniref:hypothetical protein n=1 Tax=Pseudomonas protegens TaxID=380021 RepID=UPI002936FBB7|nr:hypothetical protein [Pseudomonas protegens]WOE80478.1 hypothetical protein RZO07_04450 [Pseudomonas protegens]